MAQAALNITHVAGKKMDKNRNVSKIVTKLKNLPNPPSYDEVAECVPRIKNDSRVKQAERDSYDSEELQYVYGKVLLSKLGYDSPDRIGEFATIIGRIVEDIIEG